VSYANAAVRKHLPPLSVILQSELGTILDWIDRTGKPGYKLAPDTASTRLSASVKTRACPGHPRIAGIATRRTWMAGTGPAMTNIRVNRVVKRSSGIAS
jgi:hypothetical protein